MTRKITPAQLDEIEAVAKKAEGALRENGAEVWQCVTTHGIGLAGEFLYTHIATFDPTTALALITEVRELRAKVERVRQAHRQHPEDGGCTCGFSYPCETICALDGMTTVKEMTATRVREAEAKVERARALHRADTQPALGLSHCSTCGDVWPCATIKALGGEA